MKCNKCEFEWMDNGKYSNLTKCPLCREDLFSKKELSKEPTMAEVLVYIKENYGEDVFKEGLKLLRIFGNLAPKLKDEREILEFALMKHIEKYFIGVKESERQISINKLRSDFKIFSKEVIDTLVDAFSEAFGWKKPKIVKKKFNNTVDTFDFGNYNNNPIKWKILSKGKDSIFVISCESICRRKFRYDWSEDNANNWEKSDLRKWLNGEFYDEAFSNEEKNMIELTDSDKVTLLTKYEAETLMTEKKRKSESWWWLRSPHPSHSNYVWIVSSDGTIYNLSANYSGGVCPALHLKV